MLDAADRAAVLPGGTDMASRELIDDRQWQEERLAAMTSSKDSDTCGPGSRN